MPRYYCFRQAPVTPRGMAVGHEVRVLYIRDYAADRRSGRFVALREGEHFIGFCRIHGIVPILPYQLLDAEELERLTETEPQLPEVHHALGHAVD